MQPHRSAGGDYSRIQPCGHLCGSATLGEVCCVLGLVDAKPCKHINIKGN